MPSGRAFECLQHPPLPIGIGALTHEGLQLLAQDRFLFGIGWWEEDLGDPAIGEPVFGGVVGENVLVQHDLAQVCRGDGNGQVVPAVTGVEQPIDAAPVSARKRDKQTARYIAGNFIEQG